MGADVLEGGGGEDLLIGGRVAFENYLVAMSLVLTEWKSNRKYAERLANLRGEGTGAGANDAVYLNLNDPKATVFDDESADKLTGNAGNDWF